MPVALLTAMTRLITDIKVENNHSAWLHLIVHFTAHSVINLLLIILQIAAVVATVCVIL